MLELQRAQNSGPYYGSCKSKLEHVQDTATRIIFPYAPYGNSLDMLDLTPLNDFIIRQSTTHFIKVHIRYMIESFLIIPGDPLDAIQFLGLGKQGQRRGIAVFLHFI